MSFHRMPMSNVPACLAKQRNTMAKPQRPIHAVVVSKRARGVQRNERVPYAPPEDWYPAEGVEPARYRFVVQPPGPGYRHIVTPAEVTDRLAELPSAFLRSLEVIQLSCMTRKKRNFPCYGMQWGNSLYLYPLEESLVEYFDQAPRPNLVNETRMYGGRWVHEAPTSWKLVWTEQTIKDFYLNNILIHELGHLLDNRNSSPADREKYAEWFAIQYGYLPSRARRKSAGLRRRGVRRRHHRRAG
jgi:hypothetical protein